MKLRYAALLLAAGIIGIKLLARMDITSERDVVTFLGGCIMCFGLMIAGAAATVRGRNSGGGW
jgi:hypothetical protein